MSVLVSTHANEATHIKDAISRTDISVSETEQKETGGLPYGFGCMKGKMWMADDFDAPLEDFEEYM
jgi:hypothetical protein